MGGGGGGVEERLNRLEKEKKGVEGSQTSGKARVSFLSTYSARWRLEARITNWICSNYRNSSMHGYSRSTSRSFIMSFLFFSVRQ